PADAAIPLLGERPLEAPGPAQDAADGATLEDSAAAAGILRAESGVPTPDSGRRTPARLDAPVDGGTEGPIEEVTFSEAAPLLGDRPVQLTGVGSVPGDPAVAPAAAPVPPGLGAVPVAIQRREFPSPHPTAPHPTSRHLGGLQPGGLQPGAGLSAAASPVGPRRADGSPSPAPGRSAAPM